MKRELVEFVVQDDALTEIGKKMKEERDAALRELEDEIDGDDQDGMNINNIN